MDIDLQLHSIILPLEIRTRSTYGEIIMCRFRTVWRRIIARPVIRYTAVLSTGSQQTDLRTAIGIRIE
ncbi:hypothetical protein IEQ34_003148 [Dendrobium chrysotoxum]|uniref:Uncharacterized protein n=1 Tax=Dendrobium chrysotoxum TaxID=161865 RepID=A0AAV7HJ00_DENCH|nr:hypothetical protein IEQ34_003148 [Dendrobium chrysotoxum]